MFRRSLALVAATVLTLSNAAPALAANASFVPDPNDRWNYEEEKTTLEIMAEAKKMGVRCKNIDATAKNKCVADMINDIKLIKDQYHDAEEIEIREWHLENDPKGVTPETTKAKREYHDMMNKRKREFYDILKNNSKQTFDVHKQIRGSGSSSSARTTRAVSAADIKAAEKKCQPLKGTAVRNACVRQQLRLKERGRSILGGSVRN